MARPALDPTLYLVTDTALSRPRPVADVVRAPWPAGSPSCRSATRRRAGRSCSSSPARCRPPSRRTSRWWSTTRWTSPCSPAPTACTSARTTCRPRRSRALIGPDRLLGFSVSDAAELAVALALPAGTLDLVGIGPVRGTPTKPDAAEPLGLDGVRELAAAARAAGLVTVAIGGIDAANAAEVAAAGVDGVCVVSAICAAPDPAAAARALRAAVDRGRAGGSRPVSAPVALTVAGSDPSGGAGIQADLKTFSALGAYGTAVLTALTAQNTRGVTGVHPVPAEFVRAAARPPPLDDVEVHATKTGMLGSAAVVRAVAAVLAQRRRAGRSSSTPSWSPPAATGSSTTTPWPRSATSCCRSPTWSPRTCPRPRRCSAPTRRRPRTSCPTAARALLALGPRAVLLKGGHLGGEESVDVLATADGVTVTRRPRIATTATHGTGCTLSSALAALAARRPDEGWEALLEPARDYLQRALAAGESLGIGSGHGPVHHFAGIWPV